MVNVMKEKGFTLIEMVTVIAILGIVSMFSIGAYTYQAKHEMKALTEYMGQTIQVIQQKASLENAKYTLSVEIEKGKTYIEVIGNRVRILQYEIPKTLEVVFQTDFIDRSKIEFARDMSPTSAGTIYVKHRYLPYQIKMTVRPVTGIVTIYPLEEIEKD